MKKTISIIFGLAILFFFMPQSHTEAHQPNYVADETSIEVIDPEISKAYYGELSGSAAVYTIDARDKFDLYVNVLVPDIAGAQKNYSARILNDVDDEVATLNGESYEWERWYEEFAGDWYWQGPEYRQSVPAGTYRIEVSNPDNQGTYVLAVGEIEQFGIGNSVEIFDQLIQVKTNTFKKPWYSAFTNKIGGFLLIPGVILLVLLIIIVMVIRKKIKRKSNT